MADCAARAAPGRGRCLNRDDLDGEARELTICRQQVALPGELYCGPPKSRASNRTIALDEACTRRLVQQNIEMLEHRFTGQRRSDASVSTGPCWQQGQAMFTYADGRPIRPEYLTHRFRQRSRSPACRRSGYMTCATVPRRSPKWASHTDLKVIQQMLGHSSIVTTADTYTSVLPEAAHHAAQATADMIIEAARSVPRSRLGEVPVNHIPVAATASGYCQM